MIDELSDLLEAAQAATDTPDAAAINALRETLTEFRDELRLHLTLRACLALFGLRARPLAGYRHQCPIESNSSYL
jgi:hypothetical protein